MIVLVPFVLIVNALLGLAGIYILSILVGAEDCGQMLTSLLLVQVDDCTLEFGVMLFCGCMTFSAIGSIWFGLEHFFRKRETY